MYSVKLILVIGFFLLGIFEVNSHPHIGRRVRRFAEAEPYKHTKIYKIPNSSKEKDFTFWFENANKTLTEKLQQIDKVNHNKAKNIIFFLGDGMSVPTIAASRIYKGQQKNKSGEEEKLFLETLPYAGFAKTYCVDKQVADSACTATAYLTGVKGNFQTIGVNAHVHMNNCTEEFNSDYHAHSLAAWAQNAGKATGIITTARVTHASPAAAYAHVSYREHESDHDIKINDEVNKSDDYKKCRDIASQLVNNDVGSKLNVILGGGRRKFLTKNKKGDRNDTDLIEEWIEKHNGTGSYITNKAQLLELIKNNFSNVDHLMGLFNDDHMSYNLGANRTLEPSLAEMTKAGIKMLESKKKNGYFLFIEGGRIDHAHHATQAMRALDETVEFDKAIETAYNITNPDETLIIVTADHSHVMAFAGYPDRGNSILGLSTSLSDVDHLPYSTLIYGNGPGYNHSRDENNFEARKNLTNWQILEDASMFYPSMVPLKDETHGGDDVGVFATGPWSDLFTGVYEQSAIPHFIAYASCMNGDTNRTFCN